MAASENVTLYYFHGSYYSLKVLNALFEKDVRFKGYPIFIVFGEQNEDWYLKKNNMGEVPVLEVDGKCYSESEKIIDVIDEIFKSGPRLVPDIKTAQGSEVQAFRKLLHDIPIDVITYGVFANRHFCMDSNMLDTLPARGFSREGINRRFSGEVTNLIKVSEACAPEMKEVIETKIVKVSRKLANVLDVEVVGNRLGELEEIFDKIAERLEKTKLEQGSSGEVWLFGPTFNAADITAVGLMFRLTAIGVASRYFSSERRPIVHEYYTRATQKQTVRQVIEIGQSAGRQLKWKALSMLGMKALKISLAIGLITVGCIGLKEYLKKK